MCGNPIDFVCEKINVMCVISQERVSIVSNHDNSQPSWRILRPKISKYACAQPNVGVSSAVFRSGVSSVERQLEQKERYHAPCYSVLSVLKHGGEIEGV